MTTTHRQKPPKKFNNSDNGNGNSNSSNENNLILDEDYKTHPTNQTNEFYKILDYLKFWNVMDRYDVNHVLNKTLPPFDEDTIKKITKAIKIREYFEKHPQLNNPTYREKPQTQHLVEKYRQYLKEILKYVAKFQGYQLRKIRNHEYKFKKIKPVVFNDDIDHYSTEHDSIDPEIVSKHQQHYNHQKHLSPVKNYIKKLNIRQQSSPVHYRYRSNHRSNKTLSYPQPSSKSSISNAFRHKKSHSSPSHSSPSHSSPSHSSPSHSSPSHSSPSHSSPSHSSPSHSSPSHSSPSPTHRHKKSHIII
jgi:hypothetical protein